jgi:hypothetical protein
MDSDRMSNSANPESDRMDFDRMESDRMSNSANPESDRMESDRMSNSANLKSDRMESGRNQLKKKSGGRHHVRPFLTTQGTHILSCIILLLNRFLLLYLLSLSLSLSFTDYKKVP